MSPIIYLKNLDARHFILRTMFSLSTSQSLVSPQQNRQQTIIKMSSKCHRTVTEINFHSDFLTATCMMPLNVTGYILKRWPLGGPDHISCSIQAFVYFCCGYTSIVCLLVITINRFIIIIYRDLYIQVFSKRNVSRPPETDRKYT